MTEHKLLSPCPFCGDICDCDMDDTGGLPVPDDCPHVCPEDDFEGGFETDQYGSWFDELEELSLNMRIKVIDNEQRF